MWCPDQLKNELKSKDATNNESEAPSKSISKQGKDFKKKEEALKNEFNSVYGKNNVKEFIFCVWEKIEECSDDCKVIS